MKIAGIIAEYNPFHNGHAYHIEHTRAEKEGDATHVVAVMSGCFTQRGEPAVADAHTRAEAALKNGIDLVIALPVPWSLSSAQGFAEGGVASLNALGCVDMLSFGSECGDVAALSAVRDLMDTPRVNARFHGMLDMGISYAEAQRKAVAEVGGENKAMLLDSPNNTLGLEYLGALKRLGSTMTPFTVKRMGAPHDGHAPIGGMASASYLRDMMRAGRTANTAPFLPHSVTSVLMNAVERGACPSREELAERAVLAVLRLRSKEQLASLPALSEGIENRLYKAINEASDLESLITLAKTKRYARTRLQRLIYCAFLGIGADLTEQLPPYIRVLGATSAGLQILQRAKETATLPIVTRASQIAALDDRAQRLFAVECRATDLYALTLPTPYPCGREMTAGMIRV
ncbi:MAG: nucleotidyltransferase family protein [Clostridia bacterium]|nr:nucleotidyltransferase family protein [Clostridia bacterium]